MESNLLFDQRTTWSDVFQKFDEAPLCEGHTECLPLEVLSVPPMLSRTDGHAEMGWTLVRDQETRARLMDGPVPCLYDR